VPICLHCVVQEQARDGAGVDKVVKGAVHMKTKISAEEVHFGISMFLSFFVLVIVEH